jgi:hypothetical protein
MIGQLAAGHRFEALVLFHPEVERHEPYKLALLLSLIKANAVWWPTSASAQAFYASLASPAMGSERPSPVSAVQNGAL